MGNKNSKYKGDYYVGLDIGTGSVGWACTDTEYNLLRGKGKDMWGVRLFDEAKTAAERRMHRTSRRRRQRELARKGLLRSYFEEEISRIDPNFFQRMDESKYHLEDRSNNNKQKGALFPESKDSNALTDKTYYDKYPTIFHLREELTRSKEPHDVRLVYLALLNMFKHRGHFLNENLNASGNVNFNDAWYSFYEAYISIFSTQDDEGNAVDVVIPENFDTDSLKKELGNRKISKSQRVENGKEILGIKNDNKAEKEMLKAICGLSCTLSTLFGKDIIDINGVGIKNINFDKSNFEEIFDKLTEILDEQELSLIIAMKNVHDVLQLEDLLHGEQFISKARVKAYDEHREDLQLLKKTIKRLAPEHYDSLFRFMGNGSYSAYIASVNYDKRIRKYKGNDSAKISNKQRRYVEGGKTGNSNNEPDELYKNIKNILKGFKDDEDVKTIFNKIETDSFLRKQLTSANGVIPNQVYVAEMEAILKNAEAYLPFLKEKDNSGLTVSERIIKLFSFHMPYFVGPVGSLNDGRKNKWAVRKSADKIYPWNLSDVIDMEATHEAFIVNLIRHCTYLNDEKVLPKHSLLYEKFMVLNELNNLKIKGEKISVELKQAIYNDLFMTGKSVTMKRLTQYLISNSVIKEGEEDSISGIDQTFHNSLTSINKFNGVFGLSNGSYLNKENKDLIEKIIRIGTIYGDSRKAYEERINKLVRDRFDDKQLKRICGFKFNDWGRLSKEFLEMEGFSKIDGVGRTIIQALWETNDNLMQLMDSNKYTYATELTNRTKKVEKILSEWTFEDLEDSYLSAPVKRMVWQTLRILQEIEEVRGYAPKKVFVEMIRDRQADPKRTVSRKKKLEELYKSIKDEKELKDAISSYDEARFRDRKLYLYYCQMGRCMYSGEIIDFDSLMNSNLYDLDHIYPQHLVKDDSLDNNLVLVKRKLNQKIKKGIYPIGNDIQIKQNKFWLDLLNKGLITKEKYTRLTRTTEFTAEEKADFINRQLVETAQGTKTITEILQSALKESEVIFSKSSLVSKFRQDFDIYKCRNANDFHHAQDAYLNIVVGNIYNAKFTKNPLNFIKESEKNKDSKDYKYHLNRMFEYDVTRGKELVWKSGSNGTIHTVKQEVFKQTPIITKKSEIKSGALTNKETIWSKNVANYNMYIPMKMSDPRMSDVTKYGGRKDISKVAYALVVYKLNGEEIRSIESIPSYIGISKNNRDNLLKYFTDLLIDENKKKKITDVEIRYMPILVNSLVKRNGYLCRISGTTGNSFIAQNAISPHYTNKQIYYAKKISKAAEQKRYDEIDKKTGERIITEENNLDFYNEIISLMSSLIFTKRKGSLISETFNDEKEEIFKNLSLDKQVQILNQLIIGINDPGNGINLSHLGMGENVGKATFSRNISTFDEFVLINQSVTGLYETRIDLLKV